MNLIYIVILVFATALALIWLILLQGASREDWITAAYNKVFDNRLSIDKFKRQDAVSAKRLEQYHGVLRRIMCVFLGGSSEKKIHQLELENERLQNGQLKSVSLLEMPGYVLQRRVAGIGKGSIHKKLMEQCVELYGKKYAVNKTKQVLAKMLSYPIIGVAVALALGVLLMGLDNKMVGLAVMLVGTLLAFILAYAAYDEVSDSLNKRRAAISRQFPNVVSKLALLVTSGMIMDRAWRETAESQNTELYMEMRKTADELANLVNPAAAYTSFIDRCNTKETTKLASAIIQNLSKGNAEIGALLKSMSHEAWQERRHTAKKDSEKANSLLMIPTMLLFIAILVMIMVPVAISFSSF